MIAAITISAIAAERMTGRTELAGAPLAASVLGTALGTTLWSQLMTRAGTVWGLRAAYATGVAGGLAAAWAAAQQSFTLLVPALFVLGVGHGANQLTRYLAADVFEPSRRGRALSLVVWMGTIGAIFGPMLLQPTATLSRRWGVPDATGTYVATAVFFACTGTLYTLFLRSNALAAPDRLTGGAPRGRSALGHLLRTPPARTAVLCLVLGQAVMVFVMTMTPIHLQHEAHGLGVVGWVISGHIVGMFALSPAVGWLCDRVGPKVVLLAGHVLLAGAAALAGFVSHELWVLAVALYLLGLGWNLGFVAGSSLLDSSVQGEDRAVQRGWGDTLIWVSAASASLGSSVVFGATSFRSLCVLALAMCAVSIALAFRQLHRPTEAAA